MNIIEATPAAESNQLVFLESYGPAWVSQSLSRLNRPKVKYVAKVRKIGRYYTREDLFEPVPRVWLFNSRRLAKKYFSKHNIIVMKSSRQFSSAFGKPDKAR